MKLLSSAILLYLYIYTYKHQRRKSKRIFTVEWWLIINYRWVIIVDSYLKLYNHRFSNCWSTFAISPTDETHYNCNQLQEQQSKQHQWQYLKYRLFWYTRVLQLDLKAEIVRQRTRLSKGIEKKTDLVDPQIEQPSTQMLWVYDGGLFLALESVHVRLVIVIISVGISRFPILRQSTEVVLYFDPTHQSVVKGLKFPT